MSHMIIQVTNDYAMALHVDDEIAPQLVYISKETALDNYQINDIKTDLDIGDLLLIRNTNIVVPPENSIGQQLQCANLATEASMQEKSHLFSNTLIAIKFVRQRHRPIALILANPATGQELRVIPEDAPLLFMENLKEGSQIEVLMNSLPPRTRTDAENGIYIPPCLTTDIVWPLTVEERPTSFIKSYKLCKKDDELVLRLDEDTTRGWRKVCKTLSTAVTTVKLTEIRELEEAKLDNAIMNLEIDENNIWVWITKANLPNLAYGKCTEKYRQGTTILLSHEQCKTWRMTIDKANHGNNTICFGARMKRGNLMTALNVDMVTEIPIQGWNVIATAENQVPRKFLEDFKEGNLPVFEAQSNAKEILKVLLGADTQAAIGNLDDAPPLIPELSPILTDEQKGAIYKTFDSEIHTVIVHSPSGSGKSTTLKWLIKAILEADEDLLPILIMATTNVAVQHILAEITKEMPELEALLIPSAQAFKKSTKEQTMAGTKHSLRNKLVELLHKNLPEPENTYVSRAIEVMDEAAATPEQEDDQYLEAEESVENNENAQIIQQALEILTQYTNPRIIVATKSMVTRYLDVLGPITRTILVDEASTLRVIDAVRIVSYMSNLNKLVLVGDIKQLDTFKGSIPPVCLPLGFGSALTHASFAEGRGVAQMYLTQTFRFHPAIAEFLSELCYDNKLQTTITEDQRPHMKQLTNRELPILFVNILGKTVPAFPTSRTNSTHTKAAVWLAKDAKKKLPECTITILTYYNGQRDEIKATLNDETIETISIDAFQGRESDIVILVTTIVDKFPKGFFDNQQRLTVAFSRAKDGMFVIGHAESLRQLPNWGKFINKLKEKNNIINLIDLH